MDVCGCTAIERRAWKVQPWREREAFDLFQFKCSSYNCNNPAQNTSQGCLTCNLFVCNDCNIRRCDYCRKRYAYGKQDNHICSTLDGRWAQFIRAMHESDEEEVTVEIIVKSKLSCVKVRGKSKYCLDGKCGTLLHEIWILGYDKNRSAQQQLREVYLSDDRKVKKHQCVPGDAQFVYFIEPNTEPGDIAKVLTVDELLELLSRPT